MNFFGAFILKTNPIKRFEKRGSHIQTTNTTQIFFFCLASRSQEFFSYFDALLINIQEINPVIFFLKSDPFELRQTVWHDL
jgi:hypothetical protein